MLAAWLKNHFAWIWRAVFLGSLLPGLWLLSLYAGDGLGPNPLSLLLHTTGRSALVLLTAVLAVTPLRRWLAQLSALTQRRYGKRLDDWNWLVRLRRPLGLWCFSYALLHAWIHLHFDLDYDWPAAWAEVQEKPYVAAGMLGLALLIPLAATSPHRMVRLLGRHWRRLHRLTYAVAVTALLHFWWMMKPGLWTPWPESAALSVLLGYRLALMTGWLQRWDGSDGRESHARSQFEQGASA